MPASSRSPLHSLVSRVSLLSLVFPSAFALSLITAAVPAVCFGADRIAPARSPRLVILYAPCSVNRSYLAPYNDAVEFTPQLKKFAREAVVFRRHMTDAGQSGVAYASLFAGADARGHHIFSHPAKVPSSVYLIGEAFAENGYETYFWGAHTMATGEYGYGQGVPESRTFRVPLRAGDKRLWKALRRLREDPNAKAFLATNFTLTHSPYKTREWLQFRERYPTQGAPSVKEESLQKYVSMHHQHYKALAHDFPATVQKLGLTESTLAELAEVTELLYKANLKLLDTEFGALMQVIEAHGLRDDSLVVFTADHGETLYQQNALFKWSHGWELAPEVLQVPFLVRAPRSWGLAGSYGALTRSIDVFPTVAGLSGVKLDPTRSAGISGVDLSDALWQRSPRPPLLAYSHTAVQPAKTLRRIESASVWRQYHEGATRGEMWVSIRDADSFYRYRNLDGESWGFQAFDLASDPLAERNSFDETNETHREMKSRLQKYRSELFRAWQRSGAEPILDDAAQEALRELGYID